MSYRELNSHVIDDVILLRKVKLVTAIRLEPNKYLEDSWRCYIATIANCCEAVRSAILATAWLLVRIIFAGFPGNFVVSESACEF